jgi:hypothetical protein
MMMSRFLLMVALGAGACDRNGDDKSMAASERPELQSAPASQPAPVVPKPRDQAQLDRMILAGFTPHSDHLHAPGVDECPLIKGSDTVM